jgi:hypothetical protein
VEAPCGAEVVCDKIQALSPKDDKQRTLPAQALSIAGLPRLFMSFGLFAPSNATVTVALIVSGLSVSGAIFLMLEMYTPYSGLIDISSASLRFAVAHLGQ